MTPKSIIGPNAALRYIKAYQAHVDYWKEVNPTTALAYVDKPEHAVYIEQYAETFPDALIVARIKHDLDGGFHLKPAPPDENYYVSSPGNYHRKYGYLGRKKNIWLHVMNEPNGFGDDAEIDRLVRWMLEYIPLAIQEKTKSVLFNWGDRNPRIVAGLMDGRFDGVLQLMAEHPDKFIMGMHFYGPDEIVSHLESYVKRCERLGIVPPRVIGTEFSFDKHDGSVYNGYKSWPDWTSYKYALWEIEQVEGPLAPYIKRGVLIGLHRFQEGNSGGWDNFDYENDKVLKDETKRAAQAGELQPMVLPQTTAPRPTVPAPANKGTATDITVEGSSSWNLRTTPETNGAKVGLIVPGETLKLYMTTTQPNGGHNWYFVERANAPAAESVSGWIAYVLPVVQPPPVVVDPPPVGLPPAFLEVSAEYAMKMHASTLKIVENVRKEAAGILASNASIDAEIDALKARKASNILRAQDLESGAQMYTEIADNWKWIAEQTSPPVKAVA